SAEGSLVHHSHFRLVLEFDRIFEGKDMSLRRLVNIIQHRREGRRLTRTGRTANQDEAVRIGARRLTDWRKIELIDLGRTLGENAHDEGHAVALVKKVHPKNADARGLKRVVEVLIREEL